MQVCTCTGTGALHVPAGPNTTIVGKSTGANDYGLCNFACQRGYCPDPCTSGSVSIPGGGGIFFPNPGQGSGSGNCTFPFGTTGLENLHLQLNDWSDS